MTKCVYCGNEQSGEIHWITCPDAPEFVSYQARAELRAAGGQKQMSPVGKGKYQCGHNREWSPRNHIDRHEPEPTVCYRCRTPT